MGRLKNMEVGPKISKVSNLREYRRKLIEL